MRSVHHRTTHALVTGDVAEYSEQAETARLVGVQGPVLHASGSTTRMSATDRYETVL